MPRSRRAQPDPATEAWLAGREMVHRHPLFAPLAHRVWMSRREGSGVPADGWVLVHEDGRLEFHPTRRAAPEEWAYVAAHALLHLAFGHFRPEREQGWREWTAACDCFVARFLADLRFGRAPLELAGAGAVPARSEDELYERFRERGVPPEMARLGTSGARRRGRARRNGHASGSSTATRSWARWPPPSASSRTWRSAAGWTCRWPRSTRGWARST